MFQEMWPKSGVDPSFYLKNDTFWQTLRPSNLSRKPATHGLLQRSSWNISVEWLKRLNGKDIGSTGGRGPFARRYLSYFAATAAISVPKPPWNMRIRPFSA